MTRASSSSRVAAALAVVIALAACTAGADEPPPPDPVLTPEPRKIPFSEKRPNVLIILTDDQRASTLGRMPQTLELFHDGGTTYTNAHATTPVCCPSRASVMTGMYAHNHGVLTNGQVGEFDEDPTMQRYLKEQGYYTGVAGKFLNLWDVERSPSYFDRWAVMEDDYDHIYYDYTANVNGVLGEFDQYSTTWIGDTARGWLNEFEENDDKPWYLYLAPYAPHQPSLPEEVYEEARVPLFRGNPGVMETDRTDKAPYVQDKTIGLRRARQIRRKQLRTLYSVDDLVAEMFTTLDTLNEDRDTLVFFLSDNGHMWGEHHLSSKRWPYTESTRLPMLVRWPRRGFEEKVPRSDDRLVANIDVLPTVLDVLGIWPNKAYPADGRSFLAPEERGHLLLENWFHQRGAPDWASIVGKTGWQYIEYYNPAGLIEFQEYYNLQKDPFQLENLLVDDDATNDPATEALSERLARYRDCAINACP